MDVARPTFYELTGAAKQTASSRVEEITDQVIKKLEKDFPEGLQKAKDPDFQYALFTVQKEYARNGDKDLGDLLVDLLVDRSKQDQRDILQIVLNESLSTAPNLTITRKSWWVSAARRRRLKSPPRAMLNAQHQQGGT